ncbi:hypothetical protein V9T40_009714 [Parthenolecanium corni]|uniref:Uncharacterized protein n=1 Tax=Parthenolecanium corni TaxID=536013 RepID=A0AAN9U1C8_9HEMI
MKNASCNLYIKVETNAKKDPVVKGSSIGELINATSIHSRNGNDHAPAANAHKESPKKQSSCPKYLNKDRSRPSGDSSTSPSRLTEQNSDNSSSPDSVHSRSATYPTGSSFQMTNLANSSPSTTTLPFAQPYLAEMCNYGPIYHHHHLHGHHPSYGSYLPFQG